MANQLAHTEQSFQNSFTVMLEKGFFIALKIVKWLSIASLLALFMASILSVFSEDFRQLFDSIGLNTILKTIFDILRKQSEMMIAAPSIGTLS